MPRLLHNMRIVPLLILLLISVTLACGVPARRLTNIEPTSITEDIPATPTTSQPLVELVTDED